MSVPANLDDALVVASYNILYSSLSEGEDPWGDPWAERGPAAADAIIRAGAHLVGMQEVSYVQDPPNSQATSLIGLIESRSGVGDWLAVHASRYLAFIYNNERLEMLSTLSQAEANVDYLRSGQQRIFMWARMRDRLSGVEFLYCNTHIQNGNDTHSEHMRAESVQIITETLTAAAAVDGLPVVLGGDFNEWSWEPGNPWPLLWDAGYRLSTQISESAVRNLAYNTYNNLNPLLPTQGRWIDGVLVTEQWTVAAAGMELDFVDGAAPPLREPLGSDHNMVWAALALSAETTDPPPPPVATDPLGLGTPEVVFFVGNLRTGRVGTKLPIASGSWSTVLNGSGSVEVTIPMGSLPTWQRNEIRAAVEPWRNYLAVSVDGRVVEAGPIQPRSGDSSDGLLRVRAGGLWDLFHKRVAGNNSRPADVFLRDSELAYENLSVGTLIKRLVQNAVTNDSVTVGAMSVPLLWPADESGSESLTVPGYEFVLTDAVIRKLMEQRGGPDVAFEPELSSDGMTLWWRLRVGTNADPFLHQNGDAWIFDTATTRGPVAGLLVESDPSEMSNRAITVGDGQEFATRSNRHEAPSKWEEGWPVLETVTPVPGESGRLVLDGAARSRIDQGAAPYSTWTLTVALDHPPRPGVLRPGDWTRVLVGENHPLVPPGTYSSRAAWMRGAAGRNVYEIGLEPTLEAR